jgi:predicted alpha/beta-hydrolase family hydrolase
MCRGWATSRPGSSIRRRPPGTRDEFADLSLLLPVLERLGERAQLHRIEGGDHSFGVLKRSGRTEDEVLDELAGAVSSWAAGL